MSVMYHHHLYTKEIVVLLTLVNAVRTIGLTGTAFSDHLLSAKYSSLGNVITVVGSNAENKMTKLLL